MPLQRPAPSTGISYGTYIHGWPVQRILVPFCPAPMIFAVISATIVMSLGYLSWKIAEKPVLRFKSIEPRQLYPSLSGKSACQAASPGGIWRR